MRRWLPFQIMLAVVIALTLFSLQMVVVAQNKATATPTAAQPAGQTLQLQRTDTLVALAARFGKSVACLQKANKLAVNNTSLTGMVTIFIPDTCDDASTTTINATPTPESAESLTTATFTPIASGSTKQPTGTPSTTPTPSAFSTAFPEPTVVPEGVYTVVYGDRLAKIAEKYGLTVACIANANSISNPDLIYVGQQLRISANCTGGAGGGTVSNIPVTSIPNPKACQFDRNSGRTAPGDKYTVQAGDSLDFIACDFGIELQCLKDSNPQLGGLSLLKPGDILNINFSCPIWRDSSLPAPK